MSKVKEVTKPKLGIYELTGCSGEQLIFLHSEELLLDLVKVFDLRVWVMATSGPEIDDVDVALIEGSVGTEQDAERLKEIRKRAKTLVAIGDCACYGCIQAQSANDGKYQERLKLVYGDPSKITIRKPMEAQPVDAIVKVDYCLPGCPINARQTFALVTRLARGFQPESPKFPVCLECRMKDNDCLLYNGKFCLGPITLAGCGAVCPSYNLPCVGCFGLNEDGNLTSEIKKLEENGFKREDVIRRIRTFGGTKTAKTIEKLLQEGTLK
jgi:coenzyme F420-reducing hydrogenase gamma subunit